MDTEVLIEIAKAEMIYKKDHSYRETGFAFYHGLRTEKIALRLREQLFGDNTEYDDVIFAAALFHDIGKLHNPHNESGSRIAKELLCQYFTQNDLEKISEIILLHTDRSERMQSFPYYVKLVMDADVIDHDGTIDVWLNFWYAAGNDMKMEESVNFFDNYNILEQKDRNSKMLNFELSKKIQQDRFKFEKMFFERFKREIDGEVEYAN